MSNAPESTHLESSTSSKADSTRGDFTDWQEVMALESISDLLHQVLLAVEKASLEGEQLLASPEPPAALPTPVPLTLPPEVLFGAAPGSGLSAAALPGPGEFLDALERTVRRGEQDAQRRPEPAPAPRPTLRPIA